MDSLMALLERSILQVLVSLQHNWPFLLASIAIAALMKVFVDARKVSGFLSRHRGASVAVATAAAVSTPLCSCGTTAVVLGMMASTMPWAPIVAFMVASPLSSPEGLIYTAGLFGWPFAIAMLVSSAALGLAGGSIAAILDKRGALANQSRMTARVAPAACGCGEPTPRGYVAPAACGCGEPAPLVVPARFPQPTLQMASACACASTAGVSTPPAVVEGVAGAPRSRLFELPRELFQVGKRLLPMFLGFAFVGYLLNNLVPSAWVSALFGSGKVYGVPLAATLGLPLYISSEGSLPLVRALLDSGMSQGAVMAFLIAGSGTSVGAIAGALTIARWRVVGLVVGVLWIGAMASGFAYNLLLASGLVG